MLNRVVNKNKANSKKLWKIIDTVIAWERVEYARRHFARKDT